MSRQGHLLIEADVRLWRIQLEGVYTLHPKKQQNAIDLVTAPFDKVENGLDQEGARRVEYMVRNKKKVKPSKRMLDILNKKK